MSTWFVTIGVDTPGRRANLAVAEKLSRAPGQVVMTPEERLDAEDADLLRRPGLMVDWS